ncbi:putative membrane protein [Rhodococcoides kyotonense]|uniref:Putative membrane protein n=1 Tax=Rhodococcoides kyotonense TaxID=398843 RepID=A0A239GBB7_9NOCA|nr:putative membrane protein [Rhodococcus kyotonensis]
MIQVWRVLSIATMVEIRLIVIVGVVADDPSTRPDERFTLASERTFLAWMRTSLGLLAGGIAIVHLVPDFSTGWVRTTLGLVLIFMAASAAMVGLRRWLQVRKALESGAPMPEARELWIFAVGIGFVAVLAAVVTVLGIE